MTIKVFPVSVVERDGEVIQQGSRRGRRCPSDRHWYTDSHDDGRGPVDRATGRRRWRHEAQDIFAPTGSLVLAPEDGVIVGTSKLAGPTPKGGHWLVLEVRNSRGQAVRSYYMSHLHEAPVLEPGTAVEAGEPIALVGRTGNARTTCPHLHIGASRWGRKDVGRTPGRRGGVAINIFGELEAVDPMKRGNAIQPTPESSELPPSPPTTAEGKRRLELAPVAEGSGSSSSPSSPSPASGSADDGAADAC